MSESILTFANDLLEVEAPTPLAARTYPMTCTAASSGVSKSSGKPLVTLQFTIAAEDFPADYESAGSFPEGKQLYIYLINDGTQASLFRLKQTLLAIEGAKQFIGASIDLNNFVGLRATGDVVHEEFDGVVRERLNKLVAK